jgi:hypothetical protein
MIKKLAISFALIVIVSYLNAQLTHRLVIPQGIYAISPSSQLKVTAYCLDADRDKPVAGSSYHLVSNLKDLIVYSYESNQLKQLSWKEANLTFTGTGDHKTMLIKNNTDKSVFLELKKNMQLATEGENKPLNGVENWSIGGSDFDYVQTIVFVSALQTLIKDAGEKITVSGYVDDEMIAALNRMLENNDKFYASDVKGYMKEVTAVLRKYTVKYTVSGSADNAKTKTFNEIQAEIIRRQKEDGCYISEVSYEFENNTIALKFSCAEEKGESLGITSVSSNPISFAGKNKDGSDLSFGWNEKGEFEVFGARATRNSK